MPINKNAYKRYLCIDHEFQKKEGKTKTQLLNIINDMLAESGYGPIAKSQFYKDLCALETDFGADILKEKNGREVHMRYSDPNFSIKKTPLRMHEKEAIEEALGVLNRVGGMPQFQWVQEIVPRLSQTFEIDRGNKGNSDQIISFGGNEYLKGLEFLQPLADFILKQQSLEVEYHAFENEGSVIHTFYPYHLKQYNNRWYVCGRSELYEKPVILLALDRIIGMEVSGKKFIPNLETDFTTLFEDLIGVSEFQSGIAEKVSLVFTDKQANYIRTKPLHPSQKEIKGYKGEGIKFSYHLIQNYELRSKILSFGEAVEVTEPLKLREKIKDILQKAEQKNR